MASLGKAHTCSAPPPSNLPKVALETVPTFVWLHAYRSDLGGWNVKIRNAGVQDGGKSGRTRNAGG